MPEAPVTDDALVEEIARVIRDHQRCHVPVMAREFSAARAVLAHLRERGMLAEWRTIEWQSIEWQPIETAPKDGVPILGFIPSLYVRGASPFGGEKGYAIIEWFNHPSPYRGEWVTHDTDTCGEPSHWMPLPAAPTGETE